MSNFWAYFESSFKGSLLSFYLSLSRPKQTQKNILRHGLWSGKALHRRDFLGGEAEGVLRRGGSDGKFHRTAVGFRLRHIIWTLGAWTLTPLMVERWERRSFDGSRFCLGLVCVGRSIGLCLGFFITGDFCGCVLVWFWGWAWCWDCWVLIVEFSMFVWI